MDGITLLDVCVLIATALCVALLLYGFWLCLPDFRRRAPKAEMPAPRRRVRAGTGGLTRDAR